MNDLRKALALFRSLDEQGQDVLLRLAETLLAAQQEQEQE